jgi:hypothetical protein
VSHTWPFLPFKWTFFPPALLKYNWQIQIIYIYTQMFDICIHCKTMTTIKLTHLSGYIIGFFCFIGVCVCVIRTFRIYFPREFQLYSRVLLSIVILYN